MGKDPVQPISKFLASPQVLPIHWKISSDDAALVCGAVQETVSCELRWQPRVRSWYAALSPLDNVKAMVFAFCPDGLCFKAPNKSLPVNSVMMSERRVLLDGSCELYVTKLTGVSPPLPYPVCHAQVAPSADQPAIAGKDNPCLSGSLLLAPFLACLCSTLLCRHASR